VRPETGVDPTVLIADPLRPLLDRRLVIVTGKGGTGKTTVAAALALAAAERGKRVLVAEVGIDEHVARVLAPGSSAVGYAGRELAPGVTAMHVEPYAALADYLGLQLRAKRTVDLVLRNKSFHELMDAAPGWRELITLGKIWQLEQMRGAAGAPRFDLLIVDAPATGHGLTFLDVPRVVVAAVRSGPLRRNAAAVEALITDPKRTLLLPVALGEELPARETAELVARVRAELGIALDRVVVNALEPAPFPSGLEDLDARLARLPAATALPGLPPVPVLAACAAHVRSRHALNRHYAREIARETRLPVVELPFLPDGIRGPGDLRALAALLLGEPGGRAP
jgi:anion-transporting  ArsA/GET3 family ATPase